MAQEKVIGLRIELNGFNGVVTSIKQLEDELRKAKEDLNELEIGGKNFKTLQSEISKTETKLLGLRKASEGIGLEKKLEGYGKLAAGITSSFAAAQSAVSLFGSDSTAVAAAATQAQNLLTVALAARSIEEIGVGIATVKTTIATKAQTIADGIQTTATVGLNTAMKALFTTIAANPLGALVVVVGLVISAFALLSSKTEDATKAQKEFNDTINKDAAKGISNLNALTKTINNTTLSLDTRKKALEDLKKQFPAYFKNLKDEDILTGKVSIATDTLTTALIKQAKARALQGRIEENTVKQLELEEKLAKAKYNTAKAQERYNDARNAPVTIGGGSVVGAPNAGMQTESIASIRLSDAIEEEIRLKEEKRKIDKKILDDANKINQINGETDKVIGTVIETKKEDTKATKEQTAATREQIAVYKQLEDSLNNELASIEEATKLFTDIASNKGITIGEPKIVEEIKNIKSALQGLVPPNLPDIFKKLGFELQLLDDGTLKIKSTLNELTDDFGQFIETQRTILTEGIITQSLEEFSKTTNRILDDISFRFQSGIITKEAFDATKQLIQQYNDLATVLKKLPENVQKIFTPDQIKDYLILLKEVSVAQGDIQFEKVGEGPNMVITQLTNTTVKYTEALDKLAKFNKNKLEELTTDWTKTFGDIGTLTETTYKKTLDDLAKTGKITQDQADDLKDKFIEFQKDSERLIKLLAAEQLKALTSTTTAIIEEENQIRKFLFTVQDERTNALKLQDEQLGRAFLNNLELVYSFTQKQNKIVIDDAKTVEEQRVAILKDFKAKRINLEGLTQEEIDKIIQFYLDKQVKATEDAEKKKKDAQKKTLDNINLALQTLSKSLTDAASITAQVFQLQLDSLSMKYTDTMENIVGDTKEADQKRIESEKSYQAEKAAIEKKARITALKFTLAQAIASGAQAVVTALALPPPASFIIAGINAVTTAAQVAVISAQIQQATQLRRGGLLAGGGFISGPSHEQGGVYAGGGYTLEGNESVINRQSTLQYSGLLSAINQSGGGRPIVVQSPMDSRLVEALAKQRTEPIRAYVIEQDITKAQAINRRLEQLASF